MGDEYQTSVVAHFTYKGMMDHARALATHWRFFVLTAIGIYGALWTVFEAPAFLAGANLRNRGFYLSTFVVAVVGAFVWTIRNYVRDCPPGFEHESRAAQRIAQVQRPRWEHRLAGQLLTDIMLDLDDELQALSQGRVFVPVERRPDFAEYVEWAALAPDNLLRMVDVAQRLLILDLPTALASDDEAGKPHAIRTVVYRIRDLYRETVAFERSRRAVAAPEGAERLHELQLGWTDPVRDAVRQMFDFFDRILALEKTDNQTVAFTVVIGEPPNVDAFCKELDRISGSL